MTQEEQIITLAAKCRFDPVRWAKVAWDWGHGSLANHSGPREWQHDINVTIRDHLKNPATRFKPLWIAVASGHGIGKSAEMGMLANWAMSCWPNARLMMTANTELQLRTKTSPEVGKWFQTSITSSWFDTQTLAIKQVHDPETWRLDFSPWSEHNTEAFAGLHNEGRIVFLMFDEASNIHDRVWEVAEGAMTDENTVMIWIVFGNPTRGTGRFRECFRRYRHRWICKQIDSRTVDGTNKEYLARMVEDYGEDSDVVKVRVRGMFPEQSDRQFISVADVDAARNRASALRPEHFSFAPVIIGVDPAWTGADSTEIYLRQGNMCKHLRSLARNDNDMELANIVAMLEDEHKADAVFVDGGFGTGVISAGRTMGRNWRIVWFSSAPADQAYVNKRAEIWGRMKTWLKEGGCIDPRDQILYNDLIGPEMVIPRRSSFDGRIQLESKEDMKARGIPSPNRADALALTFTDYIAAKSRRASNPDRMKHLNFDPYANV